MLSTELKNTKQEVLAYLDQITETARQEGLDQLDISNLIDDKGNQYVDLVMEGGGVLGMSLIGYTYLLEKLGYRFLGLAGTSIGSFHSFLLTLSGDSTSVRSDWVLDIILETNFLDFFETRFNPIKLSGAWNKRETWCAWAKMLSLIPDYVNFYGFDNGSCWHNWLQAKAAQRNIITVGDFKQHWLQNRPSLKHKLTGQTIASEQINDMMFIASDITTMTRVILPDMLPLYFEQADDLPVSVIIRSSTAIPILFQPIVAHPPQTKDNIQLWRGPGVRYNGPIPKKAYLVDGAVVNNFPMDSFNWRPQDWGIPTWGIRLSTPRNSYQKTNNHWQFTAASFNTLRHILDYQYLFRNDNLIHDVMYIDTRGFNWLDLEISLKGKKILFQRGIDAALNFLRRKKDNPQDHYYTYLQKKQQQKNK